LINYIGKARCIAVVTAKTAEEALAKFRDGEVDSDEVLEVVDVDNERVEEIA